MRSSKASLLAAASASALLAVAGTAPARAALFPTDPITVNGSLSDWGISVGNNNTTTIPAPADYNPYPSNIAAGAFGLLAPLASGSPSIPAPNGSAVNPFREDTSDTAPTSFFIGPQYGGQDYDTEYMFVAMKTGASGTLADSTLYVAIVSGLRPDNGASLYAPGDVRITPVSNNAGNTNYGIEIGGGAGCSGTGCGADQATGAAGSSYGINANGYTVSSTTNSYTIGQIVENATWGTGVVPAGSPKTQMLSGGSTVGTADVVDNWLNPSANQHSIIEMSFDAGFLAPYLDVDGNLVFSIAWGPVCGNDIAEMTLSLQAFNEERDEDVPAPASLALFGAGLGLLGLYRRRRKTA